MAEHATHARSGRFIRAYLLVWGLLAAGALGYLLMLAWQPDLLGPPVARQQTAEAQQSLHVVSRTLAEVGTIRRTVIDMQNDLGQLKESVAQRETQEKAVETRLTTLEERVATIAATAATAPPAPAKQKAAAAQPKAVVVRGPSRDGAEPHPPTRIISVTETPQPAPAETTAPREAIETGSIAATEPTIVFGQAEVKPARGPVYGVQLGAGPSLDALRLSWSLLVEKHGTALGDLQPRYVPPRNEGGPYRLVAGPLPSKADAVRVCTEMGLGRHNCFSTSYMGEPL
jgi:hypothetical protein